MTLQVSGALSTVQYPLILNTVVTKREQYLDTRYWGSGFFLLLKLAKRRSIWYGSDTENVVSDQYYERNKRFCSCSLFKSTFRLLSIFIGQYFADRNVVQRFRPILAIHPALPELAVACEYWLVLTKFEIEPAPVSPGWPPTSLRDISSSVDVSKQGRSVTDFWREQLRKGQKSQRT